MKPYFQSLLQSTILKNEKFKVIGESGLQVNNLYISKAAFSVHNVNHLKNFLSGFSFVVPIEANRIFITRRGVGRTIRNLVATAEVLKRNGVKMIDSEFLTLQEQSALFAGASMVIGIHGAGLTNMIFCRSGTPVIEINPAFRKEVHLRPHYYWLACALGLPYQAVTNSVLTSAQEFEVDLGELQRIIDLQLALGSPAQVRPLV
jgi:capsular polysaccharide biosynthesis protein